MNAVVNNHNVLVLLFVFGLVRDIGGIDFLAIVRIFCFFFVGDDFVAVAVVFVIPLVLDVVVPVVVVEVSLVTRGDGVVVEF